MAETEKKPVSETARAKKKTVVISMLTFLVIGGGIFLYFVIQGSKDLTGPGNTNFHYGSVVRNSVTPFFKYIGVVGEDEEALAKSAKEGFKARKIAIPEDTVDASMDDWMKKESAPSASASVPPGGGGRPRARVSPTEVPRMSGGGGGLPRGGGGSNTAGASPFSEGARAGATKISGGAAGSGAGGAKQGGGTLGALRGAQAMLTEGLRSGSAMTARSQWDKSFGVSNTGAAGGRASSMSYGKKGLVDLDTIKSGELKNLKAADFEGKSSAAAPPPLVESGRGAGAEEDGKSAESTATDMAKDVIGKAVSGIGGGGTGGGTDSGSGAGGADNSGGKTEQPPENVVNASGKYSCQQGCETPEGVMKDNPPKYEKVEDKWAITYTGTVEGPGGTTCYSDLVYVDPKTGDVTSVSSQRGSSFSDLSMVYHAKVATGP